MLSRPRTTLHAQQLLGVGTAEVESLRSYVQRLALAHHTSVHDLMLTAIDVGRDFRNPFDSSLHSVGERHISITERLSRATGMQVADCTLARFTHLISSRALVRNNLREQRVCPLCAREPDEVSLRHARLLWEVAAVDACPRHGVRLQRVRDCGSPVGQHLRLDERPSLPGVCGTCGSAGFICHAPTETADDSSIWIAAEVGALLALDSSSVERMTVEHFRAGVSDVVRHAFDGKPVTASRMSGLAKSSVFGWIEGDSRPALSGVLKFAFAARASVKGIFQGRFEYSSRRPGRLPPALDRKAPYRRVDWDRVQSELERSLSDSVEPESMSSFAKRLSVDPHDLRRRFRTQCELLKRKYGAAKSAIAQRSYAVARGAFKDAAGALVAEGRSVTVNLLQRKAGMWLFSKAKRSGRGIALTEVLSEHCGTTTSKP